MVYMKRTVQMALGAWLVLGAGFAMACDYPARPHIPDGSEASNEDMRAAKTAVQDFLAAVEGWRDTLAAKSRSRSSPARS